MTNVEISNNAETIETSRGCARCKGTLLKPFQRGCARYKGGPTTNGFNACPNQFDDQTTNAATLENAGILEPF